VYNIPLFTGVNLAPETLARLAPIDNIFAVKDEAGINPLQTTDYILATKGEIPVYSGDDTMVLQVLLQGGVGVVSGGSHVVGETPLVKAAFELVSNLPTSMPRLPLKPATQSESERLKNALKKLGKL